MENKNIQNHYIRNILLFLLSFLIINLIRGIVFDSYLNYMEEVAPMVSRSFSTYQGIATFLSAFLLLLVYRLGFKTTLILCPSAALIALVSIIKFENINLIKIMTVTLLLSIQLFRAILPPYVTKFTNETNRTNWYSRCFWIGYLGWSFTTFLGGYATVKRFATRSGLGYLEAKELTKDLGSLSKVLKETYILSNKDILRITAVLAALAILPLLFIREDQVEGTPRLNRFSLDSLKNILNKDTIIFIIYISLVNFAMGLFAPYYTVFLNRILHIDRSTSSLIVSLSYIGTMIFIMVGPRVMRKYGQTKSFAVSVLMAMPFMLIIANGDKFGKYTVLVVGLALFLRNGFANLGEPVESSLPMELVEEEYRTGFASIINIIIGFISVLSGQFTGKILFVNDMGYRYGYYLAATIYIVTVAIMYFYFSRDYNWLGTGRDIKK